jgi:hypothetical protein
MLDACCRAKIAISKSEYAILLVINKPTKQLTGGGSLSKNPSAGKLKVLKLAKIQSY